AMSFQFLRSKNFQSALLLGFSLYSFTFLSGLAGCDNGASTKDQSSTDQGGPVETNPGNPSQNNPPPEGSTPGNPPPAPTSNVKNVILLIGSGMGPQQVGEIVQYRRLRKSGEEKLALEKLMDQQMMGLVATNSYLDLVADTSAANSSIACGLKARNST